MTGAGFGTLVMPTTIRFLADTYNYQGAMLLVAAICLHLIPLGVMFKPLRKTSSKTINSSKLQMADEPGKQVERMSKLDCNLFCDPTYVLLCIANLFAMVSSSVIFVHLAAYAQSMGFLGDASAMLYSGIGFSNFGTRVIYSFIGLSPKMKPLPIYDIILLASAICTLIVSMAKSYIALMIYAVSVGIYAACQAICVPTFMAEYYSPEKLALGFGYVLAIQAIGQISGGPLASKYESSYSFIIHASFIYISRNFSSIMFVY